MYHLHAWMILRESAMEEDMGLLRQKIADVQNLVARLLSDAVPARPVAQLNHEYVLQFSIGHNHRGDTHERALSVFQFIVTVLSCTYGLVYWYDDEVEGQDGPDDYRVLVIARGRVVQRNDHFLSPLGSVVEDRS